MEQRHIQLMMISVLNCDGMWFGPCHSCWHITATSSVQSQASHPMLDLLQRKRHSPALIPNSLATNAAKSEQLTSLNKIFLTLHRYKDHSISGPYHFVSPCWPLSHQNWLTWWASCNHNVTDRLLHGRKFPDVPFAENVQLHELVLSNRLHIYTERQNTKDTCWGNDWQNWCYTGDNFMETSGSNCKANGHVCIISATVITLLQVHPPDICGPRTQQHILQISNDFHAEPEKETDPALIPCSEIVFMARIITAWVSP
jgi:hypothetical protein